MKDNRPKNFAQISEEMKLTFVYVFSYIAITLTLLFGLNITQEIHPIIANIELATAFLLSLNLIILHRKKNLQVASSVVLIVLGFVTLSIYFQGGISGTGNLWIMVFPLLAFYLKREDTSLYWVGGFIIILIVIDIAMLMEVVPQAYTKPVLRQTFIVLIVVSLLSYYHNRIKSASQDQMFKTEANMTAILDNMQDTYFRTALDSSIIIISPSVKQLSGYTPEEVLGTNMLEYYLEPDVRVKFLETLNQNNGTITNFQLRFRHKHHKVLWTLVNAQYIYDNDGVVVGIDGTAKDITALKETQTQLEELNSSLETRIKEGVNDIRQRDAMLLQQARMAQMGEMLSMIAHQWRQPLSSITAVSSNIKLGLALDETTDPKELDLALSKINSHVAFLSSTIDDFRNFFRTNQEPKPTSLVAIMTKVLEILQPNIINNSIILHQNCEVSGTFKSFENELIQVAINIVNNAIDALKAQDSPREIWLHGYIEDKMQVITISDNGGGIDPKVLPNIFDPYFSTKSEKNGTGLGLYMSKTIVEEHCKGKLEVKNASNGACFKISLPIESSN